MFEYCWNRAIFPALCLDVDFSPCSRFAAALLFSLSHSSRGRHLERLSIARRPVTMAALVCGVSWGRRDQSTTKHGLRRGWTRQIDWYGVCVLFPELRCSGGFLVDPWPCTPGNRAESPLHNVSFLAAVTTRQRCRRRPPRHHLHAEHRVTPFRAGAC